MHPILLQTKYFTIHSLWLFIALALVIGTYSFIKLGLNRGLKLQFLAENSLFILLAALVTSRIFAIIFNWKIFFYEYSVDTFLQIFKIWDKGFSLWGAILGGVGILYYLCKKNEQSFLKWMDSLVQVFLIAMAIACVGAFLDGIWYGIETSLPWGVNFESPAIKYTVPIHPTQIYLLLVSASLAVISIYSKDHPFFEREGSSAILTTAGFSLLFFLLEFVRGDDVTMLIGTGIRVSQIIAFAVFSISLTFYFLYYKK